jgi:forespore regulator of the sigma-K checkpoint
MKKVCMLWALTVITYLFLIPAVFAEQYEERNDEDSGPVTKTIKLQRVYIDGDMSEEIKRETIWSMEDFWAQYDDWQLIDQDENRIVFRKFVDDISPLLKSNGYFGITEDGILTIFEGKPDESTKVIQSFFHIDVEKLESRQHDILKKGIPVQSKDHYVKVIETFKHYSAAPKQSKSRQ